MTQPAVVPVGHWHHNAPMGDNRRQQQRLKQAEAWLGGPVQLEAASSDASFRSYFRATKLGHSGQNQGQNHNPGKSWILMDAPPAQEDCRPFVQIAALLIEAGVCAPTVIEQNLELGFLLLDDLGQRDYLSQLNENSAPSLYKDACAALYKIQQISAADLPPYDEQLLRREIQLFPQWLLGAHLGQQLDASFYRHWSALGDTLVDCALSQPRVFVHRDYHSRNLMLIDDNNPGVLDFQDAVCGPVTYDLVSLYRDCYIQWPEQHTDHWQQSFRAGHPDPAIAAIDPSLWQHWADLMGVQRHLKAAGIFCRLWHRDDKPGYLQDIPRTLSHISRVCQRHPSLNWLADLIEEVSPALADRAP